MDLSYFTQTKNDKDCFARERRKFAIDFFLDFPNAPIISEEQKENIIKFGEDLYWTAFEDSGYIEGVLKFDYLSKMPQELKKSLLDYAHMKGNSIAKLYVKDSMKENKKYN
jgi:hypothetical protein